MSLFTKKNVTGINVSKFTLSRRLKSYGVKARVAARKEFLTDFQKQLRLTFAEEYGPKDDSWWESVIFSDEKTFG